MEHEVEPMQQPIGQIVGRKGTQSERIVALENLNDFRINTLPLPLSEEKENIFWFERLLVGHARSNSAKKILVCV